LRWLKAESYTRSKSIGEIIRELITQEMDRRGSNETLRTCTKRTNDKRCHVLTEMVGKTGECWAWSDDPEWEKKAKAAVEAYSGTSATGKWK
jgi:hypothetical protein